MNDACNACFTRRLLYPSRTSKSQLEILLPHKAPRHRRDRVDSVAMALHSLDLPPTPLGRGRGEVAAPAFALLFSEMVQYHKSRSLDISALERALEDAGADVGRRSYESTSYREKASGSKRENRLLPLLQFIQSSCWRSMFGRVADSLEVYDDDEYLLSDRDCLVNRFISVPKDLGDLNCGAFTAGFVRGILHAAGFPAKVSAYYSEPNPAADINGVRTTNILMKFEREVIEREARLG